MAVTTDDPVVIAAQTIPSVTLAAWWLPEFQIKAPHPAIGTTVVATMRKYGVDATGTPRLEDEGPQRSLHLSDLFAVATADAEVAPLIEGVTAKIIQVAKAQTAYQEAYAAYVAPEGTLAEEVDGLREAAAVTAANAVWPYWEALRNKITLIGVVK